MNEIEDPREVVRLLAVLAGIPMTDERIASTALVLPMARAVAATLAAEEYGEVEPAGGFRTPQGPRQ